MLLVLAAWAVTTTKSSPTTTAGPTREVFLYSIDTSSGSLTGPNDKHLTLRLIGTRNYLTRFTDRPLREANVVANVDFVRRFKTDFASSDPNAVLAYTPPGSQIPVSIVLTVGNPRWNAHTATWTFTATRILKQPDDLRDATVHIKPPAIANPSSLTDATLFIDSAPVSVAVDASGGFQ